MHVTLYYHYEEIHREWTVTAMLNLLPFWLCMKKSKQNKGTGTFTSCSTSYRNPTSKIYNVKDVCFHYLQYWVCTNGQAILELCSPGTLFDADLMICNWEDSVDTSNCNLWICEVDNTYYPHADCDKVMLESLMSSWKILR